jgi:hypothetical protein
LLSCLLAILLVCLLACLFVSITKLMQMFLFPKAQAASLFDNMLNVLLETKDLASVELRNLASTNILTGIGKTRTILYIYQ